MQELHSDSWKRQGSSVIFHHATLNSFIASQVSLKQALSWAQDTPSDPPLDSRTILITGLESILEILEPQESEDFLLKKVQPLLRQLQRTWTSFGIILGFNSSPQTFKVGVQDETVYFVRNSKETVNLSNGLWDGSAPSNMYKIYNEGAHIGYHVARIS
jgi:hypothetical protein